MNPMNLITLIRYRFFLFAGMLPFLLGQAIAFGFGKSFDGWRFWWGFVGIFLVLAAVEFFNEYFDAKYGGDRIFSGQARAIPKSFFAFGILAVCLGFIVGLYLTIQAGWPVMLFSFFGFLGAYFYVGTPVRWAYRGLGELVIGLCYGPFMVLGSYYVQAETVRFVPFFASLICGMSVFCIAVLNEIPDYHQDMLVGKRNLVVRLGKQKAMVLWKVSLAVLFALLILGVVMKTIPAAAIVAAATLPWVLKSVSVVEKNYDNPKVFLCAVNTMVVTHIVITLSLGLGFLRR